jgi:hypothetical protein
MLRNLKFLNLKLNFKKIAEEEEKPYIYTHRHHSKDLNWSLFSRIRVKVRKTPEP